MEKGREQSPEIFACSTTTTEGSVRRGVAHVQRRGPQCRGECAGHVVPPATTIVAADGGVEGMVVEAIIAVGESGEGRHGGGGRRR